MPLIKDGKTVSHDWSFASEIGDQPISGDVVIGLIDLIAKGDAAFARKGRLGVALPNDADLGLIAARLNQIDLITIDFPNFADGRGFSLAHEVRQTHGFKGELWASGALIPDQYVFARSCGFDAVIVSDERFARQGEEGWAEAADALKLRYQTSHGFYTGAPQSIMALRGQARLQEAAE